jgi:quercetin dioxygenase-like cupin family protein
MANAWSGPPDSVPWQEVEDRPGVRQRFLGDNPDDGPWVVQVHFEPHAKGRPHWHAVDTVYFVTQGSMSFGAERDCVAGDVRWVRAGYFYGPEAAGAEGCEFFLVGYGKDLAANNEAETAQGYAEA